MFFNTSSCYCNLLQQYVIPTLRQRQSLEITVFMQNGAPPHIVRQVTALIRAQFGDELVTSIVFQLRGLVVLRT